MDIEQHAKEFHRIRKEYGLDKEEKAEEIAQFLIKNKTTSVKEFSKMFNVKEEDTILFLTFIEKGLNLRKKIR